MWQRILYLLKTYVLTVCLFVGAKVAFMLCNGQGHPFAPGDVMQVIWHGITLDLSTALYFLILPFLVVVVSIFWSKAKVLGAVLKAYFAIVSVALALAFVADTSLYPFWQFKLDATCLQYLETPTEAMASVSVGYLICRLLLIVALAVLFYWAFSQVKWVPSKSRRPVMELIAAMLLVPVFFIGIRGGVGESTTNIGQVYYSQNQFLNHSAVNPVFSFLASFEKTASEDITYQFYTGEEMEQLTASLYPTTGNSTDTLLTTRRPNVVIILLESCGKMFLEVMPNLRKAAAEGVDFTNCYGNSYRTDRGTVSTLSGYLSFPTMSVMKMSSKVENLPAIARSLRREGYTTEYLYGGDINFTKMKGYLISTGFQQLCWKEDYTPQEQQTAKWGVRDDITFKTLSKMIRRHTDGQPFLIGYSTLSSHEPWDVPTEVLDDKVYNAFNYLDQCIGMFIDGLKERPEWDNLLVIILPDHGYRYKGIDETTRLYNHIPMLWTGGAIRRPRKIEAVCNQTDLAATLLGQMGIDHSGFTFSRDVTSSNYQKPFAYHTFNNGVTIIDSLGFMAYDLDAEKVIASEGEDAEGRLQRARALLQLTSSDLIGK